jgi:hypothetical protein
MDKKNDSKNFNILKEWFGEENANKFSTYLENFDKNSKQKISGLFDKLNEDDKKAVVDTFNNMQDLFNSLFGIKSDKRYTKKDFDGASVNVETFTNKDNKKSEDGAKNSDAKAASNNKCKCDCGKEYNNNCTKQTIAESLLNEINEEEKTNKDNKIIAFVVDAVLKALSDKKNKPYTLHPGTGKIAPSVEVDVDTNDADYIMKNINVVSGIRDRLIEKIKSPDAYINQAKNGLNIYIPLK